MKTKSKFKIFRIVLIFWCLFIGIGAIIGSTCMLIQPDGSIMSMQALLPYFQVLPFAEMLFQNYTFSGIALLIVNGITNIIATILILANKKQGIVCGAIFGFTLMAWIIIQFIIFPLNFLSTIYFVFGFLQALTGIIALIYYKQELFTFNENDYKNIGENKKRLVVFFSRMNYTKKIAYKEANRTGADIYQICSSEKTSGISGFWWCGRYGMHRWKMPIESINIDLQKYEHITICTPVWVFHIASPIKSFCIEAKGKIKEVDYIISHFNKTNYLNVAKEMDRLLGIKAVKVQSLCVRYGKIINKNKGDK